MRPEHPIINKPYIKTSDQLIAKWRTLLASEKKPIIGLHWQGNPVTETGLLKGRSMPLETLRPIAMSSSYSLLSLQKGFGEEQLERCSFRNQFVSCQDVINPIWDLLELAAIIINCDVIITTDSAVAHLAGGLGKPTWLLLQKVPEWRWGLAGDRSFWYPSMRCFRQTHFNDWQGVIEQVSQALELLIA